MPLGELTVAQGRLLDALLATALAEHFYLSGGTALSAFPLHHRTSDDLDLFTREPLDTRAIVRLVTSVADDEATPRRVYDRLGFIARVAGQPLRVEFVRDDVDHIEAPRSLYGALRVDGLRDILANKLSAMVERTEPKDYAGVLFILRQPGMHLERGIEDCRKGWVETEPAVSLDEARIFFRELARRLVQLDEPGDARPAR